MNPLERIPTRVRLALYLAYAVVGPVLIYTASRGWTGEPEYGLYVGVGTALGLTAASNVRAYAPRHDRKPDNGTTGYMGGV